MQQQGRVLVSSVQQQLTNNVRPVGACDRNDNADAAVFIADLLADRVVVECAFIRAMVAMNCDLLQVRVVFAIPRNGAESGGVA